jgi:hypothetical protein
MGRKKNERKKRIHTFGPKNAKISAENSRELFQIPGKRGETG